MIIHSAVLAEQVASMFAKAISPSSSFHLIMHNHHLEWISTEGNQEKHYKIEPKVGFWRNIKASLFAILPFENQL